MIVAPFAQLAFKSVLARFCRNFCGIIPIEAGGAISAALGSAHEHAQMVQIQLADAVRTDDIPNLVHSMVHRNEVFLGIHICSVITRE